MDGGKAVQCPGTGMKFKKLIALKAHPHTTLTTGAHNYLFPAPLSLRHSEPHRYFNLLIDTSFRGTELYAHIYFPSTYRYGLRTVFLLDRLA